MKYLQYLVSILFIYSSIASATEDINKLENEFIHDFSNIFINELKKIVEEDEIKLSAIMEDKFLSESKALIDKCIREALSTFDDDKFKIYFFEVIVPNNKIEQISNIFQDEVLKYYLDTGFEKDKAEAMAEFYIVRMSMIPHSCRHESILIKEKYYTEHNKSFHTDAQKTARP